MKKILTLILIAFFIRILSIPSHSNLITKKSQNDKSYLTEELCQKSPSFKQSLNNNTIGKLVGESEIYVKFTPKKGVKLKKIYNGDTITDDFEITYSTKGELEKELIESNSESKSTSSSEIITCCWLRLVLQVYTGDYFNCDYMAYNFCSWITKPSFKLEDGIGISVSNGLILSGNPNTRHAEYTFVVPDLNIKEYRDLPVTIGLKGNGVLATSNLKSTSLPSHITHNPKESHEWMIQTGVSYNSSLINKGRISGHYFHKEIPFNKIYMDSDGIPNVSLSISSDLISNSIFVSR